VPFDNNIGQRNVAPVAGGGGFEGLVASFNKRSFTARNPFIHEVRMTLEAVLPPFLARRDWSVRFLNADGKVMSLPPRGSRTVEFELVRGADFKPSDVPSDHGNLIEIHTRVDGLLIGGMSYQVDAKLKTPPRERPATA
jgi:hypothetical protein